MEEIDGLPSFGAGLDSAKILVPSNIFGGIMCNPLQRLVGGGEDLSASYAPMIQELYVFKDEACQVFSHSENNLETFPI